MTDEEWAALPPWLRSVFEREGYAACNVESYEVTSAVNRQTKVVVAVKLRPAAERIKVEFVSDDGQLKRRG